MKTVLQRVNPIGEIGEWWCEPCLKKHEPELYNNIMEDETEVEKDLKKILGHTNGKK
ncbi:MAG: hypothetical protein F6K19_01620 [Cyanothece sp. SIO1E1]|nr:hypothetical protein [Cyanothece sp. SIO1E1]